MVEHAVKRAERALEQYASGFQDELPRDEMLKLEFWRETSQSFSYRKLQRRADRAKEGQVFRSQVMASGKLGAAKAVGSVLALAGAVGAPSSGAAVAQSGEAAPVFDPVTAMEEQEEGAPAEEAAASSEGEGSSLKRQKSVGFSE